MMASWCEDFSTCSLEDVLTSQAENRAWGKELRQKTDALVASRLANQISRDDYLDGRKLGQQEASEYRRRAIILHAQIQRAVGRLAGI